MPHLSLHTNCEITEERKPKLLQFLSKLIEEQTGKPEAYTMVSLHQPESMIFAGSEAPAALVEFQSIGMKPAQTGKLSEAICSALEQEIGVASDRIYVQFADVPGNMWGWDKRTFQK